MSNFLNKFNTNHKEIDCPSCRRKLRVPLKPGKMLRITCPGCKSQFEISFKNPILDMFNWNVDKTFSENIKYIFKNFKIIPMRGKLTILLFIASILYLAVSFYQGTQPKSFDTPKAPQTQNSFL
jgi:hypothetical protein